MRKDWEVKKLGDVCISDLGKTLNKSKDTGLLLPYLCSINVQWNKIDLSTQKEALFEENDIKKYSVKKGDLLVCEGGDIGRAAIWSEDYSMLYQNALHRIRLDKNIIAEYVLYFLWQLKRKGVLDKRYAKGVTIKHLVKSSLLSINIPVPPLQIQQQIVEEFDRLTSIIEKQKKQLEELDNLAQAIFYDMFGDPIDNEKGWPTLSFGNLFLLRSGNSLPAKKQIPGDFKVYGGNGINGTHVEFNREGEFIIIGRVGAYCGNVRIVKGAFWLTDNAFELKQIKEIQDTIYLLFLLRSINLFKYANKAAQPVISNTVLRDIMIPLPPLPLQQQFASKIEAIEKQKELIKKSIKETEDLFNSRMDYYFN